jgi:hypothetical protein
MATQEWKTVSVKLNAELRNALDLVCKRQDITVNKLLTELVIREVEPILNPRVLPENKGVPQIGENKLKYLPETDSFVWQLDIGINGNAILSESVSPNYIENLRKAIDEGMIQRTDFLIKHSKGAVIPPKLLKYKVRKDVSTRT